MFNYDLTILILNKMRHLSNVKLTRERLETLSIDALVYGAKDTGEMGGGAAAALLHAAGHDLLKAGKEALSKTNRRVGDVAVTPAFQLKEQGVKWICHLISIIKDTPDGAYCPDPERLVGGVMTALDKIYKKGGHSIAFSALGTGEGRVSPEYAAKLMLSGISSYQSRNHSNIIPVTLALPSDRDYEAFKKLLFE